VKFKYSEVGAMSGVKSVRGYQHSDDLGHDGFAQPLKYIDALEALGAIVVAKQFERSSTTYTAYWIEIVDMTVLDKFDTDVIINFNAGTFMVYDGYVE
jgi:hypothetical protein